VRPTPRRTPWEPRENHSPGSSRPRLRRLPVLEKLSDADWEKVTEAEKWSVGVTAHHLAGAYERVPDIAMGLAAGQSFGNFTRKMLDERNAQHAKDFAGCTKEETLALHRKGAANAVAESAGSATSSWRRAGFSSRTHHP